MKEMTGQDILLDASAILQAHCRPVLFRRIMAVCRLQEFPAMERATQHELQLARRMSRLGTETAFEVLNKARALERQGKSIIHLEIGEPDFDTPANVVEAGVDALRKGWTHYGPSAGLPELRQALAEYVSRTRGVKVTSDEVVVVPGGKPIIFFTILSLIDEGDEVIYPNPGFPDLRVDDPLRRRTRRAHPTARGARLLPRRQRTGLAHQRPHQADHFEFAAESYWRSSASAATSSRLPR